jgi:peptide/nickel transport system permease protein
VSATEVAGLGAGEEPRRRGTSAWAAFRAHRGGVAGLAVLGVFCLLALAAPLLFDSDELDVTRTTADGFAPPDAENWLGTDENGRSVLALVVWGARTSLLVGFTATVISMVIGTTVGIASGYVRGFAGAVLERLTDWFLVIPFLPLAIVLATVLEASLLTVVVVIGVTSWPGTARLVRAQTLSVASRPYVERSRALGAGGRHVMTHHVLPNVMPLVLANTTLTVAIAVLAETTLSFLGLGDPFAVSWGRLLDDAFTAGAISAGAWWYLLPPGICVVLVVLSFMLVGRTLETVLNPRLRDGTGGTR